MRCRLPMLTVATSLATLVAAHPTFAADISGKTIALAHVNNFTDSYTIDATIEKGKKKHVIVIHSEATVYLANTFAYCLGPTLSVNGITFLAHPQPGGGVVCGACNVGDSCSVHGTFFLDLDEAELLSPGMFYNVPITVAHTGSAGSGFANGNAVLTVTMQKK